MLKLPNVCKTSKTSTVTKILKTGGLYNKQDKFDGVKINGKPTVDGAAE